MRTTVYFVLLPTAALVDLAGRYGFSDVIESGVWQTFRHDRTGLEHSKEQVEEAVWTIFVGNFELTDGTHRETAKQFLSECVTLGFTGCWEVHVVGGGDSVETLMAEAREYELFARQNLAKVEK
jgi:hypothetical protein